MKLRAIRGNFLCPISMEVVGFLSLSTQKADLRLGASSTSHISLVASYLP